MRRCIRAHKSAVADTFSQEQHLFYLTESGPLRMVTLAPSDMLSLSHRQSALYIGGRTTLDGAPHLAGRIAVTERLSLNPSDRF